MIAMNDLRWALEQMVASSFEGVRGVRAFGPASGKTMLIGMMTHGNEPCGLAVAWYLLTHPEIEKQLKGRVILAVHNLEGAQRYMRAATDEERLAARFIDTNMNRMRRHAVENPASLEERRMTELLHVFRQADMGIDIHSFLHPGPSMTIDVKGGADAIAALSDPMPIDIRITNMVEIQDGFPLSWWFGGEEREIPVLEIECGTNEDPASRDMAITACETALVAAGFLQREHRFVDAELQTYRVCRAVKFPNLSYILTRVHDTFGEIHAGEVLATGDGPPIIAERDCHTLFGKTRLGVEYPAHIRHEILWLTDPPTSRMRKRMTIPATS